jgi:cytochrome b6-f complex iron-sulfur subunit
MMRSKTSQTRPETLNGRRSFLNTLWALLGGIALAECIAVAIAFLQPRKPKVLDAQHEAVITAGMVSQFLPNSVTAFVRGRFYLACLSDGGFLAISSTCTHLGCSLPWVAKEMQFVCPCHGSAFDITGNVESAPAPRALDIYPITIANQTITVDTNAPIKRRRFEADQVAYPKA